MYHYDPATGAVNDMNSRVEGEYIAFDTDHLSYYAVVDGSLSLASVTWSVDGKTTTQTYVIGTSLGHPPIRSRKAIHLKAGRRMFLPSCPKAT